MGMVELEHYPKAAAVVSPEGLPWHSHAWESSSNEKIQTRGGIRGETLSAVLLLIYTEPGLGLCALPNFCTDWDRSVPIPRTECVTLLPQVALQ